MIREGAVTWGLITGTGPTTVRISGDSSDQNLALKNDDVTLATNDKVLLVRAGSAWVAVCVIGATA